MELKHTVSKWMQKEPETGPLEKQTLGVEFSGCEVAANELLDLLDKAGYKED